MSRKRLNPFEKEFLIRQFRENSSLKLREGISDPAVPGKLEPQAETVLRGQRGHSANIPEMDGSV